MAHVDRLRCAACGKLSAAANFGIALDGDRDAAFDSDSAPRHDPQRLRFTFGGRGKIDVERADLTIEQAEALRQSLLAAYRRLSAEMQVDAEE